MCSDLFDIERRLRDAFDASETLTGDWDDDSLRQAAAPGDDNISPRRGPRRVLPGQLLPPWPRLPSPTS